MSHGSSAEPTTPTLDLGAALARLGLGQYEERLKENGFDTWETVTDITEADLAELDFKLGDRRKLQRAIRLSLVEDKGPALPLLAKGLNSSGTQSEGTQSEGTSPVSQHTGRTTRRYRRHPRQDKNAPVRPKTAYVAFGEQVRQDPALSGLNFAELAKETGKRWGQLSQDERVTNFETPAAAALQRYREEFDRYKLTANYRSYQRYLEQFNKQGQRKPPPDPGTSSDDKTPSMQKSTLFNWLPESLDQDNIEAGFGEAMDTEDVASEGHPHDTLSPITSGVDEVRNILHALGIDFQLIRTSPLPLEDTTTAAVESFLNGTGSLLYFWNRDEALDLVKHLYHSGQDLAPLDAAEVFAMAAIGSHCDGESSLLVQEHFLDFFLCLLSSPSYQSDLKRMRLFACLALCRFTNNVESARRLMLCALDIGRQIFGSPSFPTELSEEQARYWWNVFKSIVFLESWFAYNTGRESRVTKQDLALYFPTRSDATEQLGTFHQKVGELGQLAAYITFDLKAADQSTKALQAQSRFQTLNNWHHNLPPPIQLGHLNLTDALGIIPHTKRSLLQLHILFLGLFIEPYRSCLIDIGKARVGDSTIESEGLWQTMIDVEEQSVLAARQSARVASLLQIDNLIRSHCWVTVLTSFTGCSVLLFSASQKLLLLSATNDDISKDLLYATSHLNVLSFCSYGSDAARKLYTTLKIIFNDIREIMISPAYQAMRDSRFVVKDESVLDLPFGYYDRVDGAGETAKTILHLARRTMAVLQDRINF